MSRRGPRQEEKRGARSRALKKRVLIVCEGEKTEPQYFRKLVDFLRINMAEVEVLDNGGSSAPLKIVERAKELFKRQKNTENPYEQFFCVIDRDEHPDFAKAVNKMKGSKNGALIVSVPCFEYWILCHFEYSRKDFSKRVGKKCSDELEARIRMHIGDYEKGAEDLFDKTKEKLDKAKENAKKSVIEAKETGGENPSTYVFELIEYLESVR